RTGEQLSLYRSVLDAAAGRPVTFRTLDVGGDKVLPYMRIVEEENPALGWRAIRLGLDRPALLRSQIRALLRAASGRTLRLMFPMIAAVYEFDEARDVVDRELFYLRRHNHKLPDRIECSVMVERRWTPVRNRTLSDSYGARFARNSEASHNRLPDGRNRDDWKCRSIDWYIGIDIPVHASEIAAVRQRSLPPALLGRFLPRLGSLACW